MSPARKSEPVPAVEAVKAQLTAILSSQAFRRSKVLSRFLRFLVEETLAGRGDSLKERRAGAMVFRRPANYLPQADPIVRIQAARLRSRLALYYQSEGHSDAILILVPKGTYAPVFRVRQHGTAEPGAHVAQGEEVTLAILPFLNLGEGSDSHLGDGITAELTHFLAEIPGLRIAAQTSALEFRGAAKDVRGIGRALGVRWVIEGSVRREKGLLRVYCQLVDTADGAHRWAGKLACSVQSLLSAEEEMARSLAVTLRSFLTGSED